MRNIDLEKYSFRLALAPTFVLLIVAAVHAYNANVHRLSPWKGGGFGMFSTADLPAARFVRVFLENDTPQGSIELPTRLPTDLEGIARLTNSVRTLPTHSGAMRLAGGLAELEWRYYDVPKGRASREQWRNARVVPVGSKGTLSSAGDPVEFKTVRVEVHRVKLNVTDWSLSSEVLTEGRMTP